MKKSKNLLNSRSLFCWLLIIGLGIKVIDVYLSAQKMLSLVPIFQGFGLTALMPTIFLALVIGLASFIERKWLYYGVSLVAAFLGSNLLFWGILYYRAEKHFIFFPGDLPTVREANFLQGNLLNQIHIGDVVFISDFIILLFVLLGAYIFNRHQILEPKIATVLVDYKDLVSSIRQSLNQMEKYLKDQGIRIEELRDRSQRLKNTKSELILRKMQLQDNCRKSQPGIQKEVAYHKTENINLLEEIKRMQAQKVQLEDARLQKDLTLKKARAQNLSNEEKIDKLMNESDLKNVEIRRLEEQDKVEKAKKIAQDVYKEILARTEIS